MGQVFRRLLITALLLAGCISVSQAFQHEAANAEASEESPIDVIGTISNHYELETPFGHVPLPRIFLVDGQWYVYGSTHQAVESGEFVEEEHQLIPADGSEITLDMSITSHLMYVWFATILTLIVIFVMVGRYKRGEGRKTAPKGWFQNTFESIFIFIRDDVAKNNLPEDQYRRFVPYLFGVFVVISFMNLFSLVPWGATATADITVTAVLATFTFIITQWNGSRDHWKHVFWFPGVPGWIHIVLTPIEIIGLFTKPFALAVRLFANMLSGKIMIICILGLIFVFADIFGTVAGWTTSLLAVPLTVALFILKAFVSLLQAYIFTLLSAVFIGMAIEEHDHEHEHDEMAVEAHT